jgi:predicted acetyltransferase
MTVELQPIAYEDKSVLRNLNELYQYEFSALEDMDVNEHGLFGYRYIDNYWTEPGRHAYFVRVDGKLAGFVLIRAESVPFSIAEFSILRKYRRRGIGRLVAHRAFDMFPGQWCVQQEPSNLGAQAFWRKIIGEYTGGQYTEMTEPDGEYLPPGQEFDNSDRA